MELLLITAATKYVCLSIAGFIFLFGVSITMYAIRTAECYDHEEDPVNYEPVTYEDIMRNERLCVDAVNN